MALPLLYILHSENPMPYTYGATFDRTQHPTAPVRLDPLPIAKTPTRIWPIETKAVAGRLKISPLNLGV